jgi:hypothetical protein
VKIQIYKDIAGNIETDKYLKERDKDKLKEFLIGLGYEVGDMINFPLSFKKKTPFSDKPRAKKKITKEIDWNNPNVIFKVLNSQLTDNLILKDVVTESNIFVGESKVTELAIKLKRDEIFKEFNKWKIENKKTENNENRNELHKEFSKIYIEIQKKLKQKRIPIGTNVLILSENVEGIIISYNEKKGLYCVKKIEGEFNGFSKDYTKKEIIIKDNSLKGGI